MKKANWLKHSLIVFIAALFSINVYASDISGGYGPLGGGNDGPSPFNGLNSKVELADGELYSLFGTVVFMNGYPFFNVDLKAHPWLANSKRAKMPYYQLEGSADFWKKYENSRIRFFCIAHSHIIQVQGGMDYVITLASTAEPKFRQ